MRPACSLPSILFAGFVAGALCSPTYAAEQPASVTFAIGAPALADQPPVTAIGLRATAAAPAASTEIVVLIETSATQTGIHQISGSHEVSLRGCLSAGVVGRFEWEEAEEREPAG